LLHHLRLADMRGRHTDANRKFRTINHHLHFCALTLAGQPNRIAATLSRREYTFMLRQRCT
jgi:hypothetical protein